MCVHACVYVRVCKLEADVEYLLLSFSAFWARIFHRTWNSLVKQNSLAWEFRGLPVSAFSVLGQQACATVPGFLYVGSGDLNSSFHICMVNPLQTEPSLQFLFEICSLTLSFIQPSPPDSSSHTLESTMPPLLGSFIPPGTCRAHSAMPNATFPTRLLHLKPHTGPSYLVLLFYFLDLVVT